MPSLLGLDSGLTVTKAVIFDTDGRVLSTARRRVPQLMPQPHHVERDMMVLWHATAAAIAEAVAASGRPANDIKGIAATAHGDGLYLLDHERQPLGPGILSLDSRAGGIVDQWLADGTAARALSLTGQEPKACAHSSLLAWLKTHDPARFARIGHILVCKDWLRFCLTGSIGTDRTEASTAFTNVATQVYDPDCLALFGLSSLFDALPAIAGSADAIGHITQAAARLTGLAPGTPVIAGLHDVTASALGIGGHRPGIVAVVAGTYSINEIVSDRPKTDARWLCRNAIAPGEWNNMAISPASAANYDWFLDTFCQTDRATAGPAIHALLAREITTALAQPSTALFHPYLFGSPHGPQASASFFGLRGWQDRGTLLRAVLEGIAFNHRTHVDALRAGFAMREIRLTGGISRNPAFAQLFADVLALPVTVTETDEAAAWGAALCAGAGVGLYPSPLHDPRDLDDLQRTYHPDPTRAAAYQIRYDLSNRLAAALSTLWPEIEALAQP